MEITRDTLLKMYETMKTIREFELRGVGEVSQRALTDGLHGWDLLPRLSGRGIHAAAFRLR